MPIYRKSTGCHVIPCAQPYFVLLPMYADDLVTVDGVIKQPVIAWLVETLEQEGADPNAMVTPVIIESFQPEMLYAILQPDGKIIVPDVQDFDSDADLISYFNTQEANDRQRKAEAAARCQK